MNINLKTYNHNLMKEQILLTVVFVTLYSTHN